MKLEHGGAPWAAGDVIIRPFRRGDAEDLAAVIGDPDVMRHVGDGRPLTGDDARRWIEKSLTNYATLGYGSFALADAADDRLFGWGGFVPPGNEPVPELIYGFARSHWGRGIGARVAGALVGLARTRFGFATILATVDDDHGRSIRILEGLGFRLEGTVLEGTVKVRRYLLDFGRGAAAGPTPPPPEASRC